jgi:hypothetical protein
MAFTAAADTVMALAPIPRLHAIRAPKAIATIKTTDIRFNLRLPKPLMGNL